MRNLSTATEKELLGFVKEHLPKTHWFERIGIHLFDEKRYQSLKRWELLEFVNLIGQEIGLYFSNTSIPSLQMSNSSIEVVDDENLFK